MAGYLLCGQLQGGEEWDPFDETCCIEQFWGDAEYLFWKTKDAPKCINLVESGTDVLIGGKKINNNWRSAGRFTLGCWFEEDQCFGLELNYLFLPKGSYSRFADSGSPRDRAFNNSLLRCLIAGE